MSFSDKGSSAKTSRTITTKAHVPISIANPKETAVTNNTEANMINHTQVKWPAVRSPVIQNLHGNDQWIKFELTETKNDVSFANALRRSMCLEVPQLAVSQVYIPSGNTFVFDSTWQMRLKLTHLRCEHIHLMYENHMCPYCSDKPQTFCPHCTVLLELDVSNSSDRDLNVTTKDIKSSDPRVMPVDVYKYRLWEQGMCKLKPEICVLHVLGKGQRIHLVAIAHKGRGKQDACFRPINPEGAFFYPFRVTTDSAEKKQLSNEKKKVIAKSCPMGVFSDELDVVDTYKCNQCKMCKIKTTEMGLSDKLIRVEPEKDRFLFTVGSLRTQYPDQIVSESIRIMIAELQNLKLHALRLQQYLS